MNTKRIGLLIQLGAILLFLLPALYLAYHSYSFLNDAAAKVGVVMDERMYYSTPGAGSREGSTQEFVPIVTYIVDQDTFQVEKMWALGEELQRGDTAIVKYQPANPENARVDTFGESYGLPSLLGVIFLIVFLVGNTIRSETKNPNDDAAPHP